MPESCSATAGIGIAPLQGRDAREVGGLYRAAVPQAIFAKMGDRFTARFMRWVDEQEQSQVWVAKNAEGVLLGVIAGTLDRPAIYRRIVKRHAFPIGVTVLANPFRPAVAAWILRTILDRIRPRRPPRQPAARPAAELLLIAVTETARGTGLALQLVKHLESCFQSWGLQGPYAILTLSTNDRANAFYRRIGATLAAQTLTRGMLVNEYHKRLPSDAR